MLVAALLVTFLMSGHSVQAVDPPLPLCYNAPKVRLADPSWRYVGQCAEGTAIWNMYRNPLGRLYLVEGPIER